MGKVYENPGRETLASIAEQFKGKSGSEIEWSANQYQVRGGQRDAMSLYSGIGSEVYAICKRLIDNPAACLRVEVLADGAIFKIKASEVASPAMLIKATPEAERKARAAKSFGREG